MFTIAQCEQRLNMWLDAEAAIASGQSYTIDNRRLDRANLAQVREQILFWKREYSDALSKAQGRNKRKVFRVMPRDL